MVVNLIISFCLTPRIGIYGTSLGGALGFLVVVLLRLKDIKKYIVVKMQWDGFVFSLCGLCVMIIGLFLDYVYFEVLYLVVGCFMVLFVNRGTLKGMLNTLVMIASRKKR
uniref:polysaccharide biosynthesis C-terminal domain-containing protein n=1 Tax=Lactiplantibacillus carotarum TaxID=2993456 RepID=UPI00384C556B